MDDDKPDPATKRRFYLIAFAVALAIDYFTGMAKGGEYRPSLIGLAVMITSALFFFYSLIRNR
ncbi:MAG: hypothetical protein HOK54_05100 [Alphaproteobacteria bacterium]|mgnify:CR=1 FL=1|jgi:hypothetical protein|nr:hypothetical protein [Alphaproteobacteria bacterium]